MNHKLIVQLTKMETEALQHVIQRILEHNRGESELLVGSLLRDTGGQG